METIYHPTVIMETIYHLLLLTWDIEKTKDYKNKFLSYLSMVPTVDYPVGLIATNQLYYRHQVMTSRTDINTQILHANFVLLS